jgi:hypothetical protein
MRTRTRSCTRSLHSVLTSPLSCCVCRLSRGVAPGAPALAGPLPSAAPGTGVIAETKEEEEEEEEAATAAAALPPTVMCRRCRVAPVASTPGALPASAASPAFDSKRYCNFACAAPRASAAAGTSPQAHAAVVSAAAAEAAAAAAATIPCLVSAESERLLQRKAILAEQEAGAASAANLFSHIGPPLTREDQAAQPVYTRQSTLAQPRARCLRALTRTYAHLRALTRTYAHLRAYASLTRSCLVPARVGLQVSLIAVTSPVLSSRVSP